MFQPLIGLFEPSAIQQLADGRFLVAEDEKEHPLSLLTINSAGIANTRPLLPPLQGDDAVWKLDDLEALALDRAGYIYALTSHSRNADGEQKKSRDKLVRFRVSGERMVEPMLLRSLKPALLAAHPALAAAAEIRDVKNNGGLNIEALEISADGQQLLIGGDARYKQSLGREGPQIRWTFWQRPRLRFQVEDWLRAIKHRLPVLNRLA